MSIFKGVLSAVLFLSSVEAVVGESGQDNMQCVDEMEVPRYSWVARGALVDAGTVDIIFRIGAKGTLEDIAATSPDPRLLQEVEGFLRGYAKFKSFCAGKRVHMLFTFRMEGERRNDPFTRIKFMHPNHFVITSQRELPTVDVIPVRPKQK